MNVGWTVRSRVAYFHKTQFVQLFRCKRWLDREDLYSPVPIDGNDFLLAHELLVVIITNYEHNRTKYLCN